VCVCVCVCVWGDKQSRDVTWRQRSLTSSKHVLKLSLSVTPTLTPPWDANNRDRQAGSGLAISVTQPPLGKITSLYAAAASSATQRHRGGDDGVMWWSSTTARNNPICFVRRIHDALNWFCSAATRNPSSPSTRHTHCDILRCRPRSPSAGSRPSRPCQRRIHTSATLGVLLWYPLAVQAGVCSRSREFGPESESLCWESPYSSESSKPVYSSCSRAASRVCVSRHHATLLPRV